jgi:ribosomal protein S16
MKTRGLAVLFLVLAAASLNGRAQAVSPEPAGVARTAAGPESAAAAARAAYDQGNYAAALEQYQVLLSRGLASADLFYDLGNAEFKLGRVGRAIGFYRRAQALAPADEDIRFNLDYARRFVSRPAQETPAVARFLQNLFTAVSGPALAFAAWVAYLLLALLLALLILRRASAPAWRWIAAGVGAVFLGLAAWASVRLILDKQIRWGVVIASQAEARNGPAAEYEVGFKIPEGREVRVLGHEGDWTAVGLTPEGYKGWVRQPEIWEDEQTP